MHDVSGSVAFRQITAASLPTSRAYQLKASAYEWQEPKDKWNHANPHQTLTALLGGREGKLLGGVDTTAPVWKEALPGLLAKWLTSSRHPDLLPRAVAGPQ